MKVCEFVCEVLLVGIIVSVYLSEDFFNYEKLLVIDMFVNVRWN